MQHHLAAHQAAVNIMQLCFTDQIYTIINLLPSVEAGLSPWRLFHSRPPCAQQLKLRTHLIHGGISILNFEHEGSHVIPYQGRAQDEYHLQAVAA